MGKLAQAPTAQGIYKRGVSCLCELRGRRGRRKTKQSGTKVVRVPSADFLRCEGPPLVIAGAKYSKTSSMCQ